MYETRVWESCDGWQPDLASSSEDYAGRFAGPAGAWLLERQTQALRQMMAPWPQAKVLDIGGGHGQIAQPLLADGHRVQVLASSEAALGQVRQLAHPELSTEVGPLTPLRHADQSFDVVTAFRMLAHIEDTAAFLAEMARVARHAVIVDFPIPGGANALTPLFFGLKKRLEGNTRPFQTMRRREVRSHLAEAGLLETQEIGQFILPMVLHRRLKNPGLSALLERGCTALRLDAASSPVVLCAARPAEL